MFSEDPGVGRTSYTLNTENYITQTMVMCLEDMLDDLVPHSGTVSWLSPTTSKTRGTCRGHHCDHQLAIAAVTCNRVFSRFGDSRME